MAQEYKRVLVAIDGSKGADAALRTAIEVTKRNDHTHLDVLRVLDLNSLEYGGAGIALDGQKIYEIEQANEGYMLKLKDKIVAEYNLDADRVSVHLRFGNPKAVITQDFQPEYGNDLIVVGSTGKNFVQRMIVGSVASYVIRTAKCDVLMAKVRNGEDK
ncbi:universal stress protein [Ligilactobacillus salivarius]|uniref:Universal stress protein family n=1 Tax=Ligilactobacillus salivarius (strain UCC118) TaxID=362948 RepID=Q1WVN6_LIGS1|nr:universal stress protein [Ligilactobacillus salivarius]MBN2918165.1 universal stress protein [Lactobacillus sp.]ABD98881.1 Universal stress protein family [Ligilactobacillus salivarius UCC118]AYC10995.1 Putative universal stress protein [Ligilactobacillus salivarius]MBS5941039.1 universal stress protein [Ligilactobacillus salivarius]MCR4912374.1 universal stress protein [Lactobacillus sp.]